jgi:hypothetical protein
MLVEMGCRGKPLHDGVGLSGREGRRVYRVGMRAGPSMR